MDAFTKACAWLFPQHCKLCHQSLRPAQQLCDYCCAQFTALTDQGETNLLLRADVQRQFSLPDVDHLVALDWYRPPLSLWLKQFKYEQRAYCQRAVSQLLAQQFARLSMTATWSWPDTATVIPLTPSRLVWRGFNQVVQLWQEVLPQSLFDVNILDRRTSYRPQAKLNAQQRRRNLGHAFSTNKTLHNQHVAIIDDVLTTGSTINAAARVLKQAGASSVSAWVVCLTPKETVQ
ncbi:ComF family protein [Pseudoalteromonas sp. YIC-656]|uniref:ComF family protein n=1 Tax=Pseudoalteromonas pernae TaxID=3118054 RepID=UPI003242BE46